MTRVKICGITNVEDALLAVELGAFAVGMVFWPGSPRHISASIARTIVDALPEHVETVGVFVNQPVDDVNRVAAQARLAAVQLHGDEDAAEYARVPCKVLRAVPLNDAASADAAMNLPESVVVLLDAHDPVKRGGTGRTIDWALAARVAAARPTVLSGGLHAGNVADAIALVRPYAIDVSSGVEQTPGRKDPEKLRALFAAVRAS